MPGVWGIISERGIEQGIDLSKYFHMENGGTYLINSAEYRNACMGRFSVKKFQKDKIFKETNHKLICTDGIILNSKSFLRKYNITELDELILNLYSQYGWKFVKKLRGNFCGFVLSKNKLIVFTDHLASKPIYYFYDKNSNTLIFASELKAVAEGMKKLGFTPHLDIEGAYYLLTFGHMLGDTTLIQEVKKIPPGNVLIYENGKISLKKYYKLSSEPYIKGSENEIIKELDKRFKKAIKAEYEKDLEYGYSHIVTLSGGLDSRMNVAYAKKLGFNDITCITFSESDYLDEKIAKKICRDNHFEFIFYALDNGNYLIKHIDEIVSSNDGLVLYSGSAHMYNCLKKLSLRNFGLIHTGQIGDLIMGSYLKGKKHHPVDSQVLNKVAYSNKLMNKFKNQIDKNCFYFNYENDELFAFYERCINGVFNGYRMIEQFTEFSSPFLYVDFLDYAMKIHPKYRYRERVYLKWINKCIPEFSKYKWEKYNLAPHYPLFLMNVFNIFRFAMKKFSAKVGINQRHSSMNPTEYWWKTNKLLRKKINAIFEENIKVLKNQPTLFEDSYYLFNKGSFMEKTQVITLLKAIKLLHLS